MSKLNALGFIEMYGLVACIEASDAMVKSANVRLLQYGEISAGMVSIIVEGDVAACQASVNAGVAAAQRVGGKVITSLVIPRPTEDTAEMILNMIPQGRAEYKKHFGGGNSSSGGNEPSPPTPPAPKPPESSSAAKKVSTALESKTEAAKPKVEAPKKVVTTPKQPTKEVKAAPVAPAQKKVTTEAKVVPTTIEKKQPAPFVTEKAKTVEKAADKAPVVKAEEQKKTEVVTTESAKKSPVSQAKSVTEKDIQKVKVEPVQEVKSVTVESEKAQKTEAEEPEIISSVKVNERKPEVDKTTVVSVKTETLPLKAEEAKVAPATSKSGVVSVMTQLVQATEGNAVTPEELDKVIQYISGAAKGYSWKEIAKKFPLYSKTKALQRKLEEAVTAGKIVKTGSRYCKKPK